MNYCENDSEIGWYNSIISMYNLRNASLEMNEKSVPIQNQIL